MVSLSSYIPDGEDSPSESASTVAGSAAEEFPPLPGTAPAPPPPPAAPAAAGASSTSAQAGAAPAPAAAAAGENPLLAAFAAERQLMEQLRDDVQAKLASFAVRRGLLCTGGHYVCLLRQGLQHATELCI